MTHVEAVHTHATERYLLDEMTELEREAFEAHFFECPECADDVKAAETMREGVKAGLLGRTKESPLAFVPAHTRTPTLVTRPWYHSAVVPWAVAATLAVMVSYQSMPVQPRTPVASTQGDGEGTALIALTPTVLRPASRGAATIVSVAGRHAALALDLEAAGASDVAYAMRTADGREILAGSSAAPRDGAPLLLVVPVFTLDAQQQYSLTVRDAARPDRLLGEFTFIVGASR